MLHHGRLADLKRQTVGCWTYKPDTHVDSLREAFADAGSIPAISTMTSKTAKPDLLRTLSEEELAKAPTLTREEIEEALRKGAEEARKAREAFAPPGSSGRRFR